MISPHQKLWVSTSLPQRKLYYPSYWFEVGFWFELGPGSGSVEQGAGPAACCWPLAPWEQRGAAVEFRSQIKAKEGGGGRVGAVRRQRQDEPSSW